MRHYYAIIHKDEDACFGVHFPAVPGCFSAGDTLDDAVRNAAEALALYFEDEDPIDAQSLEAIHSDPAVKAEMDAGAVLVAVPYIENDARTVRVNITMEAGLLKAIDDTAKSRGLTRSALLASAARLAIFG